MAVGVSKLNHLDKNLLLFSELSAGDGGEGGASAGEKCLKLQVTPSVGELLRPVSMTTNAFANEQKKLRGMNETIVNFEVKTRNFCLISE